MEEGASFDSTRRDGKKLNRGIEGHWRTQGIGETNKKENQRKGEG